MFAERRVSQAWDEHLLERAEVAQGHSTRGTSPPPAVVGLPVSRTIEPAPEATPIGEPADAPLGRLAVPRLGLSAAVREGVDDATLDVAIGHVPGTARPGAEGNVALAAHRDAEFRPLRDIRVGDEILFTSPSGETRYRVAWTRVVGPDRVDLLGPAKEGATLTLVTCYPFTYVGRAPKRFVVRAVRV
jgi:sortase A